MVGLDFGRKRTLRAGHGVGFYWSFRSLRLISWSFQSLLTCNAIASTLLVLASLTNLLCANGSVVNTHVCDVKDFRIKDLRL